MLKGRTLYLPQMDEGGARCLAAAFRSIGIEAEVLPEPDVRSLELAGRHTSGDECLPAKVVLGDFLKLLESPGVDPGKVAFMMATTEGPCRFGQYVPYFKKVLRELGYGQVPFFCLTSVDGYAGIGEAAQDLVRTAWQAVVASDILRKLLLKTRPYELSQGDADEGFEASLREICRILERRGLSSKERLRSLTEALAHVRDRFRRIPRRDEERLLIGVVGEIYCRLNGFSNDRLIRRLEAKGGEAWLSDVEEWIWYCNEWERQTLALHGKRLSFRMLGVKLRARIQRADEEALFAPFREDFRGREEPEIGEIFEKALPYLPPLGAPGEMVLSTGKAIYLAEKGVDGIVDISPFTCMNGIVAEAIYPLLSRDHGGIPIKSFSFDGDQSDLDGELEIFLELCSHYRTRRVKREELHREG